MLLNIHIFNLCNNYKKPVDIIIPDRFKDIFAEDEAHRHNM